MPLPFRDLEVFGDSISDVGNLHALMGERAVPSPPHAPGRLSNGPLWIEFLAERLGLPRPRPSLLGGRVHAHAGARSASGFAPFSRIPNLLEQIRRHLGEGSGTLTDPDLLYVVRAGANDYRDVRWPVDEECIDRINGNLLAAVEALAAAGGRWFLVPSEIPWHRSPTLPPSCSEADRASLGALIAQQNLRLRAALAALARSRGLTVIQPDTHGLLSSILAAHERWGFREVGRPALPARPDGEGHLWWDDRAHLTTTVHDLIAARAAAEILAVLPAPGGRASFETMG